MIIIIHISPHTDNSFSVTAAANIYFTAFLTGFLRFFNSSSTPPNAGTSTSMVYGSLLHSFSTAFIFPSSVIDLSLAPTPAIGDSVAYILEEMGLESCGAYGTTACLAMLNDAVKKGGVMASSTVGGLSGAFIPVSEDAGMIAATRAGTLCLEKLEAMTAVCSVGLDMVVIPGETTPEVISGIIADEAAIGMVNSKTTAVRAIPAIGKKVGEELEFGGLLGSGPVMNINQTDCSVMIHRKGRIPAPIDHNSDTYRYLPFWFYYTIGKQAVRINVFSIMNFIFIENRNKLFLHIYGSFAMLTSTQDWSALPL